MKTDRDLLWEVMRQSFESTGISKQEVDMQLAQMKIEMAQLKMKPATPLSDEDYVKRLEEMKKELPAFLYFLKNEKFPPLPPEFTGERN